MRTKVHSSLTMSLVKLWQYNCPMNSSGSHRLLKHYPYFSVLLWISNTKSILTVTSHESWHIQLHHFKV